MASAKPPAEVFSELLKFKSESGESLPAGYISTFPNRIENAANTTQRKALQLALQNCEDQVNVNFNNSISNNPESSIELFEEGLIRVETIACFKNIPADTLLLKSNDLAFRTKAFPTIVRTYRRGNLFCEVTSAPTIGESNYCSDITMQLSPNKALAQSYNVWNDPSPQYKSVVYFRLIQEAAETRGPLTVYHVISFIRVDKLNAIQKFFAKGYIAETQEKVVQMLRDELSK